MSFLSNANVIFFSITLRNILLNYCIISLLNYFFNFIFRAYLLGLDTDGGIIGIRAITFETSKFQFYNRKLETLTLR